MTCSPPPAMNHQLRENSRFERPSFGGAGQVLRLLTFTVDQFTGAGHIFSAITKKLVVRVKREYGRLLQAHKRLVPVHVLNQNQCPGGTRQ